MIIVELIILLCFTKPFMTCPFRCVCVSRMVDCQYQFFTEIPEGIPANTVQLFFEGNQISNIQRSKLSHLKELKILSFGSNSISNIEDDAFEDLSGLTRLYLNLNKLQHIKRTFFQNLTSLQFLHLEKVSEGAPLCIDDFAFEHQTQLQQLNLANNKLIRLSNNTLYGLNNLELLDLANNNIELFSSNAFKHFTTTNSQVTFSEYKPLCCCQSKEAFSGFSTNSLSLQCKNQNVDPSEGMIAVMPCVSDGGKSICNSYRESTCDLWPPLPEELASTSKVTLITSSIIHPQSSDMLYSSTRYLEPNSSANLKVSKSIKVSTSFNFHASSLNLTEPEIALTPTTTLSPSTSITKISNKTADISHAQSTIYPSFSSPASSKSQMQSDKILPSETFSHSQHSLVTSPPETYTSMSKSEFQESLPTSSTLVMVIAVNSSVTATGGQECSVKECPAGCALSVSSCKCLNESGATECIVTGEKQTGENNSGSLQSWHIALIVGSVGFIVVFVLFFVYFKKRQRRERRKFSVRASSIEMSRNNKNNNNNNRSGNDNRMSGRENNGFIIEESPSDNAKRRKVDEIY